MKVCPMCGHENPDQAIFCEVCQSNIREIPSVQRTDTPAEEPVEFVKICRSCGAENPDGADRCRTCGAFLTGVERTRKHPIVELAPMKLKFASGALLILSARENMLGRSYQDDLIWGGDPYVSGAQLRIRWQGGTWKAEDISRNGTMRNGQEMPRGESVPLRHGDKLTAGRTEFCVQMQMRQPGFTRL